MDFTHAAGAVRDLQTTQAAQALAAALMGAATLLRREAAELNRQTVLNPCGAAARSRRTREALLHYEADLLTWAARTLADVPKDPPVATAATPGRRR